MINIDSVPTYDQLYAENLRLKQEVEHAKLALLEANMMVIRARNMLLSDGHIPAYGLQPVTFGSGDNLAGGAV